MMHLFVNFLAASAGGGLTYLRNVLPRFAGRSGLHVTAALSSGIREEFCGLANVDFVEFDASLGRRFWYEQSALPRIIRQCGAQVLLSAGNFALRRSPVPQILLSRNSIYVSPDFDRDLRARGEYRAWLENRLRGLLAKQSIKWADITIAPSEAFAAELRQWTGRPVVSIHHGFDRESFIRDSGPLAPEVVARLRAEAGSFKLLFVSHYNYYRNFETLIRALPQIRQLQSGRPVKLLLTCRLAAGENPGAYETASAAALIRNLDVSDMVVELGSIPYRHLHHVYAKADLYVTPAYTETFAHPLVEAMASGLPVIASDLPVHREICGDAATYFPKFDANVLAQTIIRVSQDPDIMRRQSNLGRERAQQFSWDAHVEKILEVCHRLVRKPSSG
jgi:glycosyltransferase involved in cell wall biosynthesis